MSVARSDFLAGLPSEGSSASISLNALAWGCCRDGGQSDFFLREHFPAETLGLQREQLMTIRRALFSSLVSQAVGWFIARLFRRRALISMGKARPSVKPLA